MHKGYVYTIPIDFVPARKQDRIELLFTHKNGDFGAISEQRRNKAKLRRANLLSEESYISLLHSRF